MDLNLVAKKVIIPEIKKLPSLGEVASKKISNIENILYDTLKEISKKRAKKDPKPPIQTNSGIIFVLGDYSNYPDLKGIDGHVYSNQKIKKLINVKAKNIIIQDQEPPFLNFKELVKHFKTKDGGWAIHLDGTIIGYGFIFETDPGIRFDDGVRGMGSKAAKHQAYLDHIVVSMTLSGEPTKLVRKYKPTNGNSSLLHTTIKETTYDPYDYI